MSTKGNTRIAPADGKLGILIPGIGAVSTTFMAGVEAVKRGLGGADRFAHAARHDPAGQAHRRPNPQDQGFRSAWPAWKIWSSAAGTFSKITPTKRPPTPSVLEATLLEQVREPLEAIQPMKAVFDQEYVRRINGPNVKEGGSKMDKAEMLMDDIRQFRETSGAARLVMIWCGSTEVFHKPAAGPSDA